MVFLLEKFDKGTAQRIRTKCLVTDDNEQKGMILHGNVN